MKKIFVILLVLVISFMNFTFAEDAEVELMPWERMNGAGKIFGTIDTVTSGWYPSTDGTVVINYLTDVWLKNHWTWYMDEYPNYNDLKDAFIANPMQDFIALVDNAEYGNGMYRIENYLKLHGIDDDEVDKWTKKGFVVIDMNGENPGKMVFLQNIMEIYDEDGKLLESFNFLK